MEGEEENDSRKLLVDYILKAEEYKIKFWFNIINSVEQLKGED